MRKLRLGPLPSSCSIKLTFTCPASLKTNLDLYAAQHAQAYGEAVDAVTLIPHMLEAFMAGDRGFRRVKVKPKAAVASAKPPTGTGGVPG
jgi:hypothetical protein